MSNDFIAGAYAKRHQRQPYRVSPVSNSDGVFAPEILLQFAFEFLEASGRETYWPLSRTSRILPSIFRLDVVILADMPVKWNLHKNSFLYN